MKTISHNFLENQYYKETTKKRGIVLYHTMLGNSAANDWRKSNPEHATAPVIINGIHQLPSFQYWHII